jgi:hypothetical protein
MIKSGRLGQVKYNPLGVIGVGLVPILSLNNWKLSLKTDRIEVTSFGDTNKVYVPGMKDVTGDFSGFWNSDETVLFEAVDATTPGLLDLVPNTSEPDFHWSGLAYLDAEIDTAVNDAPKVTGSFMAAGPWAFDTAA